MRSHAWEKRGELATSDYSFHMAITYWSEKVAEDMQAVVDAGITTFKHFMAYKGALMVNDEELFASFRRCAEIGAMPMVHAENGEVVAALQKYYLAKGVTGPEAHALSRPPRGRGRSDQSRHHARRSGGRAALCRPYLLHRIA